MTQTAGQRIQRQLKTQLGPVLTAALLAATPILLGPTDSRAQNLPQTTPGIATPKPKPAIKSLAYPHVQTRPITSFKIGDPATTFNDLTFLGGFEILSQDRNVGGLSGVLSLDRGDRLVMITDNGRWVFADLKQDPRGAPLAISNLRHVQLRNSKGRTLDREWGHNTEALAIQGDAIYVAAERANTIYKFPWPLASGQERMISRLDMPESIRKLPGNTGLEALAAGPKGTPHEGSLIAIAERSPTNPAALPAYIFRNGTVSPFTLTRSDNYDATDAAFLPNGDLLLLERRFNMRDLLGMRLRRFNSQSLLPDAELQGEVLLEADFTYQIDNMEGLAVHQDRNGRTILTIVSDNNRSILQRTLLLRFELRDE